MIALPATLLKIFLSTTLLTALIPLILFRHKHFLRIILLSSVIACFIESLNIAYFYIYSGRASWKLVSLGTIGIEFSLEPLGIILINLVTGIWAIFALYFNSTNNPPNIRLLTLLGLTIFASIFVALSRNLFSMFIGYEMLSVAAIMLTQKRYAYMSFGAGIFLIFILFIYIFSGTADFILDGILPHNTPLFFTHLLLLAAISGIAKTIIFVANNLLKQDVNSYTIEQIFQAIVILNIGLYSMLKIIIYIFGIRNLAQILSGFNWPLLLSALLLLYASYKAIISEIIKHILVYSILAGLFLILMSIFALTPKSIMAGISHMIAHSFTQITLFFVFLRFYRGEGVIKLEELRGLGYKFPFASLFFIISSLSLLGIPPFAASSSTEFIWEALSTNHYSYILKHILVLSIIAMIYYIARFAYFLFENLVTYSKKEEISALDIVTGISAISIVTFPIVEKFLNGILWSIL
jgi:multicomponent Na+:H+ antiporter subunit D